eukprot:TRINITY_DN47396_c0_g1_i1.p1 TRINITY_DN47396_c0_g1~~TRINITY_DN47396_c0_g1_i1.p1  ORF type:complete len:619 (+),score=95.67 TRINITY_DN47396_c0_g1_i1:61-1917(+)
MAPISYVIRGISVVTLGIRAARPNDVETLSPQGGAYSLFQEGSETTHSGRHTGNETALPHRPRLSPYSLLQEENTVKHETRHESKVAASLLLDEIEARLGPDRREALEPLVPPIEVAMRPIFQALPVNQNGNAGPSAARYALHRLFVGAKGWIVKGLQDATVAYESPKSPVAILQDAVPESVKELFESRLNSRGLSFGELTILAAILDHLVDMETLNQAKDVFKARKINVDERMPVHSVENVLEQVMMSHILAGTDEDEKQDYFDGRLPMEKVYPNWPQTKRFLRQVENVVAPPESGSVSLSDLQHIIQEVNEHYGRWQDKECTDLRDELHKLEGQCPGRVDLRRFYGSALYDGKWQFTESMDYLRSLNDIDDSRPGHPSVIVPNYLAGPSNCISGSKFYEQCCIDPCDSLMAKLEGAVGKSEASAAAILAALESTSPTSKESLSFELRRRLDEISQTNGGVVPLQGRLFAQWMHHAHPRVCTFPALPGSVQIREDPDEYTNRTGKSCCLKKKELTEYYEKSKAEPDDAGDCRLPWSADEQLVVSATERMLSAVSTPTPFLFVARWQVGVCMMVASAAIVYVVSLLVRNARPRSTSARGPLLEAPKTEIVSPAAVVEG